MKAAVCLLSLTQTVFHLSLRKVTLSHARGHQHQRENRGLHERNSKCKVKGQEAGREKGDRVHGADLSCKSHTAANSQASGTKVVLTFVLQGTQSQRP